MPACLQVTHTVLVTPSVLNRIRGTGSSSAGSSGGGRSSIGGGDSLSGRRDACSTSPFRAAVVDLLLFFTSTYLAVFKFKDPPLHDPCAVAYAIAPHIFKVGDCIHIVIVYIYLEIF